MLTLCAVAISALGVGRARTAPPAGMFAEYLAKRNAQAAAVTTPTSANPSSTSNFADYLAKRGAVDGGGPAVDEAAAAITQELAAMAPIGVADTIAVVGSTPPGAQKSCLGLFTLRSEQVNGRASYVKDDDHDTMLWWHPGETVGAWMVGRRDNLGSGLGWATATGEAVQPASMSRGRWQIVAATGWNDAPELQVLHNLPPAAEADGPPPELMEAVAQSVLESAQLEGRRLDELQARERWRWLRRCL